MSLQPKLRQETILLSIRKVPASHRRKSYYELRYTDPGTDREVIRRVSGANAEKIRFMAEHMTRSARQKRTELPDRTAIPTVDEGIRSAIRLANTSEGVTRERARHARRFTEWLAQHFPTLKTWERLSPAIVRAYAASLEQRGLAYDSIRLGLAPVKLGWRLMNEEFPDLTRPVPQTRIDAERRSPTGCLDPGETRALLDWMRHNDAELWPMAALQALAGLRMREAAALRREDVDLAARTLTVRGKQIRASKMLGNLRTLPVCREVHEALAYAIDNQKIRPASGELFMNRAGGLWKKSALTPRWSRALVRAARETKVERLQQIPARELRRTFAIMASRLGTPDYLIRAYMGYASGRGDLLSTHHRKIELDDLKEVPSRFDRWREIGSGERRGKQLRRRRPGLRLA